MDTHIHIPTEVYLDFLGRTIEIHWHYHAILMVTMWAILIPAGMVSIRYFKPRPTKVGITTKIAIQDPRWLWFNFHKYLLTFAVGMSVAGMLVALVVSKGFSGSVHSAFGLGTIALGCLQLISAWLRGTHGGRYYYTARPDKPETWHGDHFSMTPRRRRFETYHKTAGYFALFCATGAVASGLMQFPMPALAWVAAAALSSVLVISLYREHCGKRYDTYRSVFGNDAEHPHNKARDGL